MLLKTESGHLQLLRVGPAPGPGTPAAPANNIAANSVVGVQPSGTAYRLTTVPGVSRMNAQFTAPTLGTIRKPIQVMHYNSSYKTQTTCIFM